MRRATFGIALVFLLGALYYTATFDFVEYIMSTFNGSLQEESSPVVPIDESDPDPSNNNDDGSPDYLLQSSTTNSDDGESESYNTAPRTSSIPYNFIDKTGATRYFLYSPSGGLSNQLIELSYALEIGRLLNRTVFAPMIARHSSGWRTFESLSPSELFPADRIIDFPWLSEKTPCIPLNVSVERFAAYWARTMGGNRMRIVYHPHRENWGVNELMSNLASEKRRLVYLRGAEMYHKWFSPSVILKSRKRVRFAPALRKRAVEIVHVMFPSGQFNAMHVRLADYSARWGTFQERSRAILLKPLTERFGPKRELMNKSLPIYLASDEPNNGGFVELKKLFTVLTAAHLPKDLVEDYRNLFPKSTRSDMMGVLEQLICAQAIFFTGTSWSTFSEHIEIIRASKRKLFPELVD